MNRWSPHSVRAWIFATESTQASPGTRSQGIVRCAPRELTALCDQDSMPGGFGRAADDLAGDTAGHKKAI